MSHQPFESLNLPEVSEVDVKDVNAVQHKFNFPGKYGKEQSEFTAKLENAGIHFQAYDEKAAYEKMAQTAPDRYVRGDHFDNGERFTPDNGLPATTVKGLRRDLVNNGFKLAKCYWKRSKNGQVVVVVEYANFKKFKEEGKFPELTPIHLSPQAENIVTGLIDKNWICHGWNNPNKVDTVNLTGSHHPPEPQHRVTAKSGLLRCEVIPAC